MPKARLGIALTELWRSYWSTGPATARNAVGAIAEQLASENVARLKRLGRAPGGIRRRAGMTCRNCHSCGNRRRSIGMAMEPGSLAFFDGILRGVSEGKSYYPKEDLIFEILSHLRDREPTFRKYFRAGERLRGLRLSVRSPR
jgi:hypothetical protein